MTYNEAFVQTTYGSIFIKSLGDITKGNVLVFLHDALGSASIWGSFPERVRRMSGLPIIVFDRLGYGRSDDDSEPRSVHYLEYEAQVRLPELLVRLNVQNPILLGHSDGGSIALVYAANFKTKAIISMAAHIYEETITRQGIRHFFEREDFPLLFKKLQKHHGSKAERVLSSWREIWLSEDFVDWNISSFLKDISCQSLIIQGKQDDYGSDAQVLDIQRLIGCEPQVLFIDNCWHVPYKEQKDLVLTSVVNFLAQLSP